MWISNGIFHFNVRAPVVARSALTFSFQTTDHSEVVMGSLTDIGGWQIGADYDSQSHDSKPGSTYPPLASWLLHAILWPLQGVSANLAISMWIFGAALGFYVPRCGLNLTLRIRVDEWCES